MSKSGEGTSFLSLRHARKTVANVRNEEEGHRAASPLSDDWLGSAFLFFERRFSSNKNSIAAGLGFWERQIQAGTIDAIDKRNPVS